jgi:starch synthase
VKDTKPHVLIVAAECGDIAKVGGLGDVVRDLSKALKLTGTPVSIVVPCYDQVRQWGEATDSFPVRFGTRDDWTVQVFRRDLDAVPIYLLRSDEFFGGEYGEVYIDSDRLGRGPFEDDGKRFAFFSAAACELMLWCAELHEINALHCHDWHTGVLLVLLKHDPRYQELASTFRTLFTIHNLDYQGTRPFELSGERRLLSFAEWFPELYQDLQIKGVLAPLSDTHTPIPCFNPMRAGINLADTVNTVSPKYAREITLPDDPGRNFIGGRGLEGDLKLRGGRLYGILNGLDYEVNNPSKLNPSFDVNIKAWQTARRKHKLNLLESLDQHLQEMVSRLGKGCKNGDRVLSKMSSFQPDEWKDKLLVVAVTRAVHQKASILLETLDGSATVLEEMLKREIYFILFGTGELENQLEELNHRPNGLFVCAFDPKFANLLYAGGDLFLMPSDFEPCGITQMIAMRYGCLPLVPAVGGLSNTVEDMRTGFVYSGATRQAARQALLDALDKAIDCFINERARWEEMQIQALSARFEWSAAAKQYIDLYTKQANEIGSGIIS